MCLLRFFAYERTKRNQALVLRTAFSCAAVCFLLVFLIRQPAINIVLLVMGILSSNTASSMMWSCYCPSLRDTGMVSGATGFLDFCSYMAASVSSKLFVNAVDTVGWGGLVLVWCGLMVCGVLVLLINYKKENGK